VRDDAFSIWSDTPPQQSIDSLPDWHLKGGCYHTHTSYIDQRVILSLHTNILDSSQSALSFIIGSDIDRSAFKARSSEPRKMISIYAHHNDLRSSAQLAISVLDRRKRLTSDRMHGQRTNAYKSVRGFRLTVSYSAKT
jgi:hypothetical protein